MRACRSETWARCAPSLVFVAGTFLMLLAAAVFRVGLAGGAEPTRKAAAADTTKADGGFNVRVSEEGARATTTRDRARREAERARESAQGAAIPEAPEPPEPPDLPDPDFESDASDNNVVRFGEDITIPEGKVIDGDVVALGGSVTVRGRVKGDCVAVGGAVRIEGKGVVEGDAVSMGGGVSTSDSGSVGGSNVSLGNFPGHGDRFWPMVGFFGAVGTGVWLVTALVKLALTFLFAWLALLLARERMVYAVDVMAQRFGKSFLWGLLGWAGMVVAIPTGIVVLILVSAIAIAILAITIIGIPLAILLVIALVLGIVGIVVGALITVFLGFLNGAMFLGRRILGRNAALATKPLVAILVGMALVMVLDFAGDLLQFVGLIIFHPIAIALGIAAGALAAILTTAGFGAMLVTRFASGPRGEGAAGSQWWPSKSAPASAAAGGGTSDAPAAGTPPPGTPSASPPPEGGSSDAP